MPDLKKLTYAQIENSPEICDWLSKFGEERIIAIEMLMRLRFVGAGTFSTWLRSELLKELAEGSAAVFAVRKWKKDVDCVWDENGVFLDRPGYSLGSEDVIQGYVANLAKGANQLYDHPNISEIKTQRISKIVLLDDSIGSGRRVAEFVEKLFTNKTFLSRWSLGVLRISVIAFSRMLDADKKILAEVKGSNHERRKFPANSKIAIRSYIAQRQNSLSQRWGPHYPQILDLCDGCNGISKNRRRGFKKSMANLVFEHSIPNNVPGLLWFQSATWDALFPYRSVPNWLYLLLGSDHSLPHREIDEQESHSLVSDEIRLLSFIKKGVRRESSIAWKMGLDVRVVREMLLRSVVRGLLTPNYRITEAGRSAIQRGEKEREKVYNWELYRPKSWCAD